MYVFIDSIMIPLIISSLLIVSLFIYTVKQARHRASLPFLLTLTALFIWSIGYIFEIGSQDLSGKLFWANLQFLGIGGLPILWLVTVLILTGREQLRISLLVVTLPIPVLTNIFAWTDRWLHLLRGNPQLTSQNSLLLLEADYTAWHNWVFVPFQYILYGFSIVLLLDTWTHSKPGFRRRYLIVATALLIPMLASSFYIIGIPPFQNLNLTPAFFSISCLLMTYVIFNKSILDIVPLAREEVVENLKDIILVFDSGLRLVDYNQAALGLLPNLKCEDLGSKTSTVLATHPALAHQLEQGKQAAELNLSYGSNRSSHRKHYRSALSFIRGKNGEIFGHILTISDITAQIELLNKMQLLATTDSLTGILNRRSFFEQIKAEISRAQRYGRSIAIILLDLDHFKKINDSHGHAAGDKVLVELSARISAAIRKEDIFGRYGGEEFALCLPETEAQTAFTFAERLRMIITKTPVLYDGKEIRVSASFGVTGVSPITNETQEQLLLQVDKALYTAKELGRNRSHLFGS